ncbi:8428_t:CDS:1, partial [Cetraspora pellucida]
FDNDNKMSKPIKQVIDEIIYELQYEIFEFSIVKKCFMRNNYREEDIYEYC